LSFFGAPVGLWPTRQQLWQHFAAGVDQLVISGSTPRLWHNYRLEAFPMLASGNSEGSFPNPAS
jgi:hypothetical protein